MLLWFECKCNYTKIIRLLALIFLDFAGFNEQLNRLYVKLY